MIQNSSRRIERCINYLFLLTTRDSYYKYHSVESVLKRSNEKIRLCAFGAVRLGFEFKDLDLNLEDLLDIE